MKKTITETIEEFDNSGKLIKRTIKSTTEEDNYYIRTIPYYREYPLNCGSSSTTANLNGRETTTASTYAVPGMAYATEHAE